MPSRRGCSSSMRRPSGRPDEIRRPGSCPARPVNADGPERNCTGVAALVDTNVLVYRFDPRFPDKQLRAQELLRSAILDDSVRVAHQAVVEFVAAVSRPTAPGRAPLLPLLDAIREAEELLAQFTVLYPDEHVLR